MGATVDQLRQDELTLAGNVMVAASFTSYIVPSESNFAVLWARSG